MPFDDRLIELIRDKELLYDRSNNDYRNNELKDQEWRSIARELNTSMERCKKRWASLRDRYKRIQKQGSNSDTNRQWKHFDALSFVPCTPRNTDSTVDDTIIEKEKDEKNLILQELNKSMGELASQRASATSSIASTTDGTIIEQEKAQICSPQQNCEKYPTFEEHNKYEPETREVWMFSSHRKERSGVNSFDENEVEKEETQISSPQQNCEKYPTFAEHIKSIQKPSRLESKRRTEVSISSSPRKKRNGVNIFDENEQQNYGKYPTFADHIKSIRKPGRSVSKRPPELSISRSQREERSGVNSFDEDELEEEETQICSPQKHYKKSSNDDYYYTLEPTNRKTGSKRPAEVSIASLQLEERTELDDFFVYLTNRVKAANLNSMQEMRIEAAILNFTVEKLSQIQNEM